MNIVSCPISENFNELSQLVSVHVTIWSLGPGDHAVRGWSAWTVLDSPPVMSLQFNEWDCISWILNTTATSLTAGDILGLIISQGPTRLPQFWASLTVKSCTKLYNLQQYEILAMNQSLEDVFRRDTTHPDSPV